MCSGNARNSAYQINASSHNIIYGARTRWYNNNNNNMYWMTVGVSRSYEYIVSLFAAYISRCSYIYTVTQRVCNMSTRDGCGTDVVHEYVSGERCREKKL